MDLARLRQETAGEHAQTEETVPLMRPGLTRAEYAACLHGFYRVAEAWDRWSDAHAPADLAGLRAGRRRASLLLNDLRSLGEAEPVPGPSLPTSAVPGDARSIFLGRMYVMEGSTLGGQYIAAHVEQELGLAPGQGDSFFRGYGEATGQRWQEFRAVLGALPDSEAETVIASAREMFVLFGKLMAGEKTLEAPSPHTTPENSIRI